MLGLPKVTVVQAQGLEVREFPSHPGDFHCLVILLCGRCGNYSETEWSYPLHDPEEPLAPDYKRWYQRELQRRSGRAKCPECGTRNVATPP